MMMLWNIYKLGKAASDNNYKLDYNMALSVKLSWSVWVSGLEYVLMLLSDTLSLNSTLPDLSWFSPAREGRSDQTSHDDNIRIKNDLF